MEGDTLDVSVQVTHRRSEVMSITPAIRQSCIRHRLCTWMVHVLQSAVINVSCFPYADETRGRVPNSEELTCWVVPEAVLYRIFRPSQRVVRVGLGVDAM